MSKHLEKILMKELQVLNDVIDEKIIKGQAYAAEAKRHKFLMARILNGRKSDKMSFFKKLPLVPTFFL